MRFYLTDRSAQDLLTEAIDQNDYVFAYSLIDLGEVEGFEREQKVTQVFSLRGDEQTNFDRLNKNNRYKVRRSYRDEGVDVVADDPDRAGSFEFYRATKAADGVAPDIDQDFDMVRWINGYLEGELAAATCWFDSGEYLRAKHIVSGRKSGQADTALIGRLTRRLFWEACLMGLKEGHTGIDLGGLDPDDPSKSGVASFKQSFGGETVPTFVYRHSTVEWHEVAMRARDRGSVVV